MIPGTLIFLNGTSSAGKTTLAHQLQATLAEPWQHIALDQFRDGLPARYRGLNAPPGTTGEKGLNVVPVHRDDLACTEIRFGDYGKQLLRGMRRAIAEVAHCGNNVIIDDIILEAAFLDDYLEVMQGLSLYFIGVRCPIEVINQREAARLGRFPGTAEGHFNICHAHNCYDLEVNTAEMMPQDCAHAVIKRIEAGPPAAFDKLRA